MPSDIVTLALIAAIPTFTTPLVMAVVNHQIARQQKQEDYARQDVVAAKAAEAAELLLASNEKVAKAAKVTDEKLDVIHTLVNSNMTAAMKSELDAITRELAMMQEVVELKRTAGKEPSTAALSSIESTKDKIKELQVEVAKRLEQDKTAQLKEIRIAKESGVKEASVYVTKG